MFTRLRSISLALAAACLLSACAAEISGNPSPISSTGVIGKDLQAAGRNLESAVKVGALSEDDPAPKCLANLLADLGLDGTSVTDSFAPERAGIVSEGSILYVRAQQLKQVRDYRLPTECEAIVGRFVLDSARAGVRSLPFSGVLLR